MEQITAKQQVTIFKDTFTVEQPYYITVDEALERIKSETRSYKKIAHLRGLIDKDQRNAYKKNLPAVCWSGTFKTRNDSDLIKHSGLLVIDFDDTGLDYREILEKCEYAYAVWLSPSGTGFKMLVKIADVAKHREHFAHIKKHLFPDADPSGVNTSRMCYESYDPELYINPNSKTYSQYLEETIVSRTIVDNVSQDDVWKKLLKWMANKNDAFVNGNRNIYIFKLAGACCRYGIDEHDCIARITNEYMAGQSSFSQKEVETTIKSAYKKNKGSSGTAKFDDKYRLIDVKSTKEINIEVDPDKDIVIRDIIFADDVRAEALAIKNEGYGEAETSGVEGINFDFKRGDVTLLTGYGNQGKSTFLKYLQITKSIIDGQKWCVFGPEDFPPHEYYHQHVEMYEGELITPDAALPISDERYLQIYDWVGEHFFYCYPKDDSPTPEYILTRFLEMMIVHGVTGFIIDPYNGQHHDYSESGGRDDKYLEKILSVYDRFAKVHNIILIIVAHPTKPAHGKQGAKDYPCPDVFDIAGGAMWNNKMDNILVYYRPQGQSEPMNPAAEFHKKKIRRQKIVGKRGVVPMEFNPKRQRFIINGVDYLGEALRAKYEKAKLPTQSPQTVVPQTTLAQEQAAHFGTPVFDNDNSSDDLPF